MERGGREEPEQDDWRERPRREGRCMAGRELRVERDEVLSDAKKAVMRRCVPSAGGAAATGVC